MEEKLLWHTLGRREVAVMAGAVVVAVVDAAAVDLLLVLEKHFP